MGSINKSRTKYSTSSIVKHSRVFFVVSSGQEGTGEIPPFLRWEIVVTAFTKNVQNILVK